MNQAVLELLFGYETLDPAAFAARCEGLSPKWMRWLGAHHPDNRTRRAFFERTNVTIGEGAVINAGFVVSDDYKPLLRIGARAAISPGVTVICASGPNNSRLAEIPEVKEKLMVAAPVSIGDDAWIGAGAIVLPGVSIGKSAIVGAGAVVSRDVADHEVVAGAPARVVRKLPTKSGDA